MSYIKVAEEEHIHNCAIYRRQNESVNFTSINSTQSKHTTTSVFLITASFHHVIAFDGRALDDRTLATS